MRHRLALAATSASIMTLVLAATALAGGWANAVMDTPPDDPVGPNQPVTLGFTLMQHGVTPVDWGSAQVVLTNDETGAEIVATAHPQGRTGHWVAQVALPTEGSWTYTVRHDLEITLMRAAPITVSSAPAGSTAIGPPPAMLAAGGALAVLGICGLAGLLLAIRHGRRPDELRA